MEGVAMEEIVLHPDAPAPNIAVVLLPGPDGGATQG